MRKIFLFNLMIGPFSLLFGQEYRPLETFNKDTISYLKYNFIERKDVYIGKELKVVIEDYEIFPFNFSTRRTPLSAPDSKGQSFIYGISLWYHGKRDKHPNGRLYIKFKEPYIDAEEFRKMGPDPDDDRAWALKIGDVIVVDLELKISTI
ncbi:MAG: hypothetical protein LUD68_08890 [Rikenellaceae bacterium]|nr:hypothetical protein [Rikenellaceae bacterium]